MKTVKFYSIVFLFSIISCSSSSDSPEATPTPTPPPIPTPTALTDAQAMDQVQKDAIKYFWEYAETNSKLARERYHTDDPGNDAHIVTTGGSGFGLMSIIVGIERGFLPRVEAVSRLTTALNFLANADRFHGAWPHWMNGETGRVCLARRWTGQGAASPCGRLSV